MNESPNALTDIVKGENRKDEIALIDILRIVWKWKYLVLVGTIVCGLIAAAISFNMRKIYSIDMILSPDIVDIGKQGKIIYIDSPQKIKALINSGMFNNDILNYLNEKKMKNIPKNLSFNVTIPANSDMIKVVYETGDTKQGLIIQDRLSALLMEKYSNKVKYFKNEYDVKLESLKSELDYIKATIRSFKRNVKNIEKRIDDLNSESKLIKDNTSKLINERNKLLSENPKEKDILSVLVYTNTIQQNLQLSNNYQNEINDYKIKKEEELQKIEKSENEITNKLSEIKNLKYIRDSFHNIELLQPATSSRFPVKPKKTLNTALALMAGFFLFVFISFFLEYLNRHKNQI